MLPALALSSRSRVHPVLGEVIKKPCAFERLRPPVRWGYNPHSGNKTHYSHKRWACRAKQPTSFQPMLNSFIYAFELGRYSGKVLGQITSPNIDQGLFSYACNAQKVQIAMLSLHPSSTPLDNGIQNDCEGQLTCGCFTG